MEHFQVSPLLSKDVEHVLAVELARGSHVKHSPEMSLLTTNCGIASHAIALYVKEQHDIQLDPHVGDIDGMTFSDSLRPFKHVLLRNPEKTVIVDPTPLQVVRNTGLTIQDAAKFPATPNTIAGEDRIFEIYDTPEATEDFSRHFIGSAITRARTTVLQIQPELSKPADGSQAFLSMNPEEIHQHTIDMWNMDNYQPDPLAKRTERFQRSVARTAQLLLALSR